MSEKKKPSPLAEVRAKARRVNNEVQQHIRTVTKTCKTMGNEPDSLALAEDALCSFISSWDPMEIVRSLRRVEEVALYMRDEALDVEDQTDLYMFREIIKLVEKIALADLDLEMDQVSAIADVFSIQHDN